MTATRPDDSRLFRHWFQYTKYELRYYLGHYPAIFIPLMKFQREYARIMVDQHTDIVIEGYPRCGNTFAVAAFILAQRAPVTIARHSHVPAQVFRAVDLNRPTLILIRNPHDAVLSTVIRHPFLSIERELSRYIDYYTAILPYREHFVVGQFQDVITDFGRVVDRVNRHFGTAFERFVHTEENVQRVFRAVEEMDKRELGGDSVNEATVARPSPYREQTKRELEAKIGSLSEMQREANKVYERVISLCL